MAPGDHGPTARQVPDRFESFDVTIERIGETYRARVTSSPIGPTGQVPIEASALDVGTSISQAPGEPTRDLRCEPIDRDDLRRRGERLFRAVITGPIAESFRASVERVRNQGIGLRIRLRMDDAPELAALPWEALWDPTDRVFLNDQPDLPVTRALNLTSESPGIGPQEAERPLRLLALLPEPRGESKISGADEWRQIEDRLSPWIDQGRVEATRLEPPPLETLGNRIDESPCDVLHVVAHGEPGDPGAGGLLKLESPSGAADPVTGVELARALERRTPPRLVVLNACHGARAAIDDAFDGMAQHLLSRGVPAVLAMRTAISDAAAVGFATALYSALASGQTVEAATIEARRRLSLGEHRTEWSTPVLYLRDENVRILHDRAPRAPQRPSPRWIPRTAGAASALGLGALAVLMWPTSKLEICPPPPGLHDLELIRIEPGVVPLETGALVVEEPFCIATKETSRRDWQEVTGDDLPRPDRPLDLPMTHVTPGEVETFLERLETRDPGSDYGLPTPTQWEYAARAATTTDFFFGDDESQLHRYGNCRNVLGEDGREGPAPVGSYKPNAWSLYDVHGNVAEWVLWPEPAGPAIAEDGREQALRLGGSYTNVPRHCSFPSSRSTVKADIDNREDTGFRVIRTLP